jgi:hypothetical protein
MLDAIDYVYLAHACGVRDSRHFRGFSPHSLDKSACVYSPRFFSVITAVFGCIHIVTLSISKEVQQGPGK